MENFVYLTGPENGTDAWVIDPAWDVDAIDQALLDDGKTLKGALITHCHGDHINGLPELLRRHDIPVYAQKAEIQFSAELRKVGDALIATDAGDQLLFGDAKLKFLHTPGHTPGSQCMLVNGSVISGDTLFINGCGRCDMKGGNAEDMYRSISNILLGLPDTTRLYPGHDYAEVPSASWNEVKATNPYLQFSNLKSFVDYRMGGG